jgi:hypothetical protein
MKSKIFMALAALLFVACMLPLQGCYEESGYGYGPGYYAYSEPWYGRRYVSRPWYDDDDWSEHQWRWHPDHDEWGEHHWWHLDDDDWARAGGWHYRDDD